MNNQLFETVVQLQRYMIEYSNNSPLSLDTQHTQSHTQSHRHTHTVTHTTHTHTDTHTTHTHIASLGYCTLGITLTHL